MTEITKSHVKTEFFKDLSFALWLELRNRWQKLIKTAQTPNFHKA